MDSSIKKIEGRGVPLKGNDIDTDRIIPARFLLCVTFDGLGESAFLDDRTSEDGKHPFDQKVYQGASILIVNRNFGCGSSREHAPQALKKWGISCIVGESFAEIFAGNCLALGIPCLTMPQENILKLQEKVALNPDLTIVVDIATGEVETLEFKELGHMEGGVRDSLLSGQWDVLGQLLNQNEAVENKAKELPYLSQFTA